MPDYTTSYNKKWLAIEDALNNAAAPDLSDVLTLAESAGGRYEVTNSGWSNATTIYESDFTSNTTGWAATGATTTITANETGPDGTDGWMKIVCDSDASSFMIIQNTLALSGAGHTYGDAVKCSVKIGASFEDQDPVTFQFFVSASLSTFDVPQDVSYTMQFSDGLQIPTTSIGFLNPSGNPDDLPSTGDVIYIKDVKVELLTP